MEANIPSKVAYEGVEYAVTSIGSGAFSECKKLESVSIPASVVEIRDFAFQNCDRLNRVFISDLESWCNIDFEFFIDNPIYHAHNLYLNGELAEHIVIPEGIQTLKSYVFGHCTNLKSVKIPDSVTSIGNDAFYMCEGLESVKIPDSVTSIGFSAFYGCKGMRLMEMGKSVKTIESNAFYGCDGLHSVSVADIMTWYDIEFKNYDSNPLYYAHNLYVGDKLMTSISIPNGIEEIKQNAFVGCTGATTLTIPPSVKKINDGAFLQCKFFNINVYPILPPECYAAFSDYSAYLHVQYGCKDRYQDFNFEWKKFKSIVYGMTEDYESAVEEVEDDRFSSDPVEVFDLQGVKVGDSVGSLAKGIYVVRQGNTVRKIAVK